jgi:hypothetical protein
MTHAPRAQARRRSIAAAPLSAALAQARFFFELFFCALFSRRAGCVCRLPRMSEAVGGAGTAAASGGGGGGGGARDVSPDALWDLAVPDAANSA